MMQKVTVEDIEAVMDEHQGDVISRNELRRLLERRLRLPKHSLDDQESKDEIKELCRQAGYGPDSEAPAAAAASPASLAGSPAGPPAAQDTLGAAGSPAGPPAAAEEVMVEDIGAAIMGEAGSPAGSPAGPPAAADPPGASDFVPLEAQTVQQLVLRLKGMGAPVGRRTKTQLVARLCPGPR